TRSRPAHSRLLGPIHYRRACPRQPRPARPTPRPTVQKGHPNVSVFEKYKAKAYPNTYVCELHVAKILGGTPTDPRVAEGWIKSKMGFDSDKLIQDAVAEVMVERGVTAGEAVEIVNSEKNLNGFKRDESGLYVEGRQIKAAIKEAANIRYPAGRWS